MTIPVHPEAPNTMGRVLIDSTESPNTLGRFFNVSGSVNPDEDGTYDVDFYTDRVALSRVIKKRYCIVEQTFEGASPAISPRSSPEPTNTPLHIRSVAELVAVTTSQPI